MDLLKIHAGNTFTPYVENMTNNIGEVFFTEKDGFEKHDWKNVSDNPLGISILFDKLFLNSEYT